MKTPMTLLVLTGPPAVGKLTVATHLAKRAGFRLFHNHLTFDVALALFEYGTLDFFQLCDELRLTAIRAAVDARISGLILTFCMATEEDHVFLSRCVRLVNSGGGVCRFVTLHAPENILLERVTDISRRKYAKTQDREELRHLLHKFDFNLTPRYESVLRVDTALHSPAENVSTILDHISQREGS